MKEISEVASGSEPMEDGNPIVMHDEQVGDVMLGHPVVISCFFFSKWIIVVNSG